MDEEAQDDDDEFVSDDNSAPDVVPVTGEEINNERPESEVSDINLDDFESSSEYDSDDLDPNTTENPHGFVYSNMLDTMGKSRRDRIEEMRELRDSKSHRDKYKKKQNSKKIGKSERVHQKNKPFMMMKQKKIRNIRDSMKPVNAKKSRVKRQLGHYTKQSK